MKQEVTGDQLLEEITREAIEAAKEGKWDEVAMLYERRALNGELEQVSPQMARQLMVWDQWLAVRIQEAQAAAQHHMTAIQQQRRKLGAVKRQWGMESTNSSRHLLSV